MEIDSVEIKSRARGQINAEIESLPGGYIEDSDEGLFHRVLSLREFIDARNIMVYHSVKREPDTVRLIRAAYEMGKNIAFPYCFRGGIMQARAVRSLDELTPAMLGIPAPPETAPVVAPETLDMIIVPALAYDRRGYRIGYGGGYYDRFLQGLAAFTVGLARERLMKEKLPSAPHDIAVRCVVTERAVLRLDF